MSEKNTPPSEDIKNELLTKELTPAQKLQEDELLEKIIQEYPQLAEQDFNVTQQPIQDEPVQPQQADIKAQLKYLEQQNEQLKNIIDGKIRNKENEKNFIGTATGDTASENQDAFLNGFLNN